MYRSRGSCEMGSPFTTANGISTCSGGGSGDDAGGAGGAAAGVLLTTIFSSGRGFMTPSVRTQVHAATDIVERLTRRFARLVGALGDDVAHQLRIVLELLGAAAHPVDLFHHLVDERLFALEAADPGGTASVNHPLARALVGIDLVQVPHRALLRIARIVAPYARRIGLHGA